MENHAAALKEAGWDCLTSAKGKAFGESSEKRSLDEWAEEAFKNGELIVFTGALGIAVRAIAPYVKNKKHDPAVLVSDEKGDFVIPVLSGHLGGANRWASFLSEKCGGRAVITTATDVNGIFSVDTWAKDRQMVINDMAAAKEISASLLRGESVAVTVGPGENSVLTGSVPPELEPLEYGAGTDLKTGILITSKTVAALADPFECTLRLTPKNVYMGIGCRRGAEKGKIKTLAAMALDEAGVSPEAVAAVASIDLKMEERGIAETAADMGVPFLTFSAEELADLKGAFTPSELVKSVTGVDNVCERSALAAAEKDGEGGGIIIVKKKALDGVTAAVALKRTEIIF